VIETSEERHQSPDRIAYHYLIVVEECEGFEMAGSTRSSTSSPASPAYGASSSSSSSSNPSTSQRRLQNIAGHMSQPQNTSFPADVVPQAPEDPLFGLMAAYRADTFDNKVDLGIGAYRDNTAKPWVLPVVKKVSYLLSSRPCSEVLLTVVLGR